MTKTKPSTSRIGITLDPAQQRFFADESRVQVARLVQRARMN